MTDYIQLLGYRFEIMTCGTSGIPFIDTCIDAAIIASIDKLMLGMLSAVLLVWVIRQAKFAG